MRKERDCAAHDVVTLGDLSSASARNEKQCRIYCAKSTYFLAVEGSRFKGNGHEQISKRVMLTNVNLILVMEMLPRPCAA